jgi:hypothetical protein
MRQVDEAFRRTASLCVVTSRHEISYSPFKKLKGGVPGSAWIEDRSKHWLRQKRYVRLSRLRTTVRSSMASVVKSPCW